MNTSECTIELLRNFQPLSQISDVYLEQLKQKSMIVDFNTNDTIVRSQRGPSQLYHYLLEGDIEYRISMMERSHLYHSKSEQWCRKPLEELLKDKGGSIRAKSHCRALILSKSHVDDLVQCSLHPGSNTTDLITLEELSEDILIDDHFEDDWNGNFLHSPLASNLSPTELQNLLQAMSDHDYSAGDTVIKENTWGDTFYLIKTGRAEVSSNSTGPLKEPIELWPGDYFGDESLITGAPRNATIRMLEDGVLGCLNQQDFDDTLRQALVRTIDDQQLEDLPPEKSAAWIDVRLPIEFRQDHISGSLNRPISTLRKHLSNLDSSTIYIVAPNAGPRSTLATYLLRQHGLEAYLYTSNVGEQTQSIKSVNTRN